jgi:DNA repair protein RadC
MIMKDEIKGYLNEIFGADKIDVLYKDMNTKSISTATEKDLMLRGITPRLAQKIVAIFKIRHATPPNVGKRITQSSDAYDLVRDLGNLDHEQFDLLLLSQANNVINRICHSKCGIAGTIVDKRLILLDILRNKAAAVILAHNHPSGNITPSKADIDITKQVKDACKMIGVSVLDHIIVASEHPSRYTSLADEGHM